MHPYLVTEAEEADLPTRKVKAARSQFMLLEKFSNSPLVDPINRDDVIPLETDSVFDSSTNTQIEFMTQLST
jgi:hypothetical protein